MAYKPDDFRRQVGRYKERWYCDPIKGDRRFKATKEVFPSVSTVKGSYPKFLTYWAGNTVAEYAYDNLATWKDLRRDEAIPLLAGAHERDRNRGGERGTKLHVVAEKLLDGRGLDPLEVLEIEPLVLQLRRFLDDWKPTPILSEVPVIHRGKGYASGWGGTLDLIATFPTVIEFGGIVVPAGEPVLLDFKSRKPMKETEVYDDEAIQLAAYAKADYYFDLETGERKELPQVIAAAIVAISSTGYHIHPIKMEPALAQWAACLALWKARIEKPFADRLLNPTPNVTAPAEGLDPFTGLTAQEKTKAGRKQYTCHRCGTTGTSTFMEPTDDGRYACKAQRACEKRQRALAPAPEPYDDTAELEAMDGEPYEDTKLLEAMGTVPEGFNADPLVTIDPVVIAEHVAPHIRPTLTVVRETFGEDVAEVLDDEAASLREWLVSTIKFYQELTGDKEHGEEATKVLIGIATRWPVRGNGKPVPTFTESEEQTLEELRNIDAAVSATLADVKPAFGPTRPDTSAIDGIPAKPMAPWEPPRPIVEHLDSDKLDEDEYREVGQMLADLEIEHPDKYLWLHALAVKCHVSGWAITIASMPFWRRANILIALREWAIRVGTSEEDDETLRNVISAIVGATVPGDRLPAAVGALTMHQSNMLLDWINEQTPNE